MDMLIDTITKMRKYFIQLFVAIRYSVIAKEVLLVVVAMIPKAATRIVLRLIFFKFSSLIVDMCWPNPRVTI